MRPSNTEPLLRLNAEAPGPRPSLAALRDRVLALIRDVGGGVDLDPVLLEILACPCEHHAPVEPDG